MTETGPALNGDGQPIASLLFVDDEPAILSALRRVFRPPTYKVFMAPGGAEGLALLASENIDLVISDARMPEMDGATFLKEVSKRWPDVVRIMLTGYADIQTTITAINEGKIYRYLNKPWDEAELKAAVETGLRQRFLERERERLEKLTKSQNDELAQLNQNLNKLVAIRTSELQQTADMLDAAYAELKGSYEVTVRVFSSLIHMRKGLSSKSNQRIVQGVRRLCQLLNMSPGESRDTVMAASLYNVGKLSWSDELVTKPIEALTETDWLEVRRYPVLAETILMTLEPLKETIRIIRHHQEQFDGKGYPDKLAGATIPLGARILKLVVDFEALVTGGWFNRPLPLAKAIEHLRQHAGTVYDPAVVARFAEVFEKAGSQEAFADHGPERQLKSGALKVGMELSRDLYSATGVLLLNKGKQLTDVYIARIVSFEASEKASFTIYVRPEPVAVPAPAPAP